MTGMETTMNTGFEAMLKRIDQRFDAVTIQPARSAGPPRRSFGPRRNVSLAMPAGKKGITLATVKEPHSAHFLLPNRTKSLGL
jgi:hypothetical protein